MTCLCSLLALALSFQLLTSSSTPASVVVDLERYGEVGLLLLFLATLSHVDAGERSANFFPSPYLRSGLYGNLRV